MAAIEARRVKPSVAIGPGKLLKAHIQKLCIQGHSYRNNLNVKAQPQSQIGSYIERVQSNPYLTLIRILNFHITK